MSKGKEYLINPHKNNTKELYLNTMNIYVAFPISQVALEVN